MQLVDRALGALEILSKQADGMSVSDLSEALGIPASSTHRVLASLKANHFVLQDTDSKRYRLGYKLFGMAAGIGKNGALTQAAKPYMKQLSEKIDRNVVLCVMENRMIMNIACSERKDSNMYMVKIGYEMPLYSTSAGRVFAAHMDRERALVLLGKEDRTKTTPYTKTGLQELNRELDAIVKQGYALIDEELQMGIQGAACPVFDMNGEVAAALAFTTLKDGDITGLEQKIRELKQCAALVTEAIR